MRIKATYDGSRESLVLTLTSSTYTDAMPLVQRITVANARPDWKNGAFVLGCAILLHKHIGETLEFEGGPVVGSDFAEAIRTALSQVAQVTPLVPADRTLNLAEMDIASLPARRRDLALPVDAVVPMMTVDWSGDFVPPGERRSTDAVAGRYFTNAGLVADETTVSIALGLIIGGSRIRRLVVPVDGATDLALCQRLAPALAIAGIALELVPVHRTVSAAPAIRKQAVVMYTHTVAPRILEHFARLKRETAGLMAAYLAVHEPMGKAVADADITVGNGEMMRLMPRRFNELIGPGRGRFDRGYTDLVTQTFSRDPLLHDADHIWMVEYDVDFAGNWRDFFSAFANDTTDLLVSRVMTPADQPHWINWEGVRSPPQLPVEQRLGCFMPASRQSRRFIDIYGEEIEGGAWQGHSECTMPSIAAYRGLSIKDLLCTGPYAFEGQRMLDHPTWGYRPARSDAYFHEKPENFSRPGFLYHPVKAVPQADGQLVTMAEPEPIFSPAIVTPARVQRRAPRRKIAAVR